jgi:hypothetical protein
MRLVIGAVSMLTAGLLPQSLPEFYPLNQMSES